MFIQIHMNTYHCSGITEKVLQDHYLFSIRLLLCMYSSSGLVYQPFAKSSFRKFFNRWIAKLELGSTLHCNIQIWTSEQWQIPTKYIILKYDIILPFISDFTLRFIAIYASILRMKPSCTTHIIPALYLCPCALCTNIFEDPS